MCKLAAWVLVVCLVVGGSGRAAAVGTEQEGEQQEDGRKTRFPCAASEDVVGARASVVREAQRFVWAGDAVSMGPETSDDAGEGVRKLEGSVVLHVEWHVLGPFTHSKLELDADGALLSLSVPRWTRADSLFGSSDRSTHVLDPLLFSCEGGPGEDSFLSEVVTGAAVRWTPTRATASKGNRQQHLAISFPAVDWNGLVTSMSRMELLEFSGWVRGVLEVKAAWQPRRQDQRRMDVRIICQGVHTFYIREPGHRMHHLAGDIYFTGHVWHPLRLAAGMYIVLAPLRGKAQMQMRCEAQPGQSSAEAEEAPLVLSPPRFMPDLVDGFWFSGMVAVPVANVRPHTSAMPALGVVGAVQDGPFVLAPVHGPSALPFKHSPFPRRTNAVLLADSLHAGQTTSLDLELLPTRDGPVVRKCNRDVNVRLWLGMFDAGTGTVVGEQQLSLAVRCRHSSQSFIFTFLDHDESIAHGAVVLPPEQSWARACTLVQGNTQSAAALMVQSTARRKRRRFRDESGGMAQLDEEKAEGNFREEEVEEEEEEEELTLSGDTTGAIGLDHGKTNGSPTPDEQTRFQCHLLVSLHGTNVSPESHADSHKYKPRNKDDEDFRFGVDGYFVLAPSRQGAHNWEHSGRETAAHSIDAFRDALWQAQAFANSLSPSPSPSPPPPWLHSLVAPDGNNLVVAGHSQGAHGALVLANMLADRVRCVLPFAAWIEKEHYADANSDFVLDKGLSFTDERLKAVARASAADTSIDRVADVIAGGNMLLHLRVGERDRTVHPFFSRRLHLLLRRAGGNVTLEEVPSQEHWWWDTDRPNDGGVMLDRVMRRVYRTCRATQSSFAAGSHSLPPGALSMTVVSPSVSRGGRWGMYVLQQHVAMQESRIQLVRDAGHDGAVAITTSNVRRLRLGPLFWSSICGEANTSTALVRINGHQLPATALLVASAQEEAVDYTDVCIACDGNFLEPCVHGGEQYTMFEKSPWTSSPARVVSSRPFFVVYGTGDSSSSSSSSISPAAARVLRETALYVANQHFIAYGAHVPVYSDRQALARSLRGNAILVGGRSQNAYTAAMMTETEALHQQGSGGPRFTPPEQRLPRSGRDADPALGQQISVYTMPLPDGHEALVLHGSTGAAYTHIQRLSWPTVPPMVRSPFSHQFPDFFAARDGRDLWTKGWGAADLAGFWNATWQFDAASAFERDPATATAG